MTNESIKLEEVIGRYEHPIIGVIGATNPSEGYNNEDAKKLGYELRKLVSFKGSIFTGGVYGVGLDLYDGIIDYCMEHVVDDKFFVLFPDIPYNVPEEYHDLAKYTQSETLRVEKLGKDMDERRTYIGAVADLLILINGSSGTIDEALKGLILGKPVVCLENSGGAADVLTRLKKGEVKIPLNIDKNLIKPFVSIDEIVKYLSNEALNNSGDEI
jgi:predicted Rossmann-fold nucleotide-binding protein